MAELDRFEARFVTAYRRYLAEAPVEVDAVAIARQVAAAAPRRHALAGFRPFGLSPALAWTVLLAALLAALVGGALLVGSQPQRRLPAVVSNLGPVATCPPGSNPDEPGPVNQARPAIAPWASASFDRRAGKAIALALSPEASQDQPWVETWTFDVCTNTWTRMHPDRELPGDGSGRLVYDVASGLMIGIHEPQGPDPRTGRVWAYDLEADTWTEHGVAPTFGTGFYDPVSGLVVAGVQEDLWNYDVETDAWTPISQATRWEGLGRSMYVYDASVDRIVVYGLVESLADTRLFDLRTGTWSRSAAETPVFEGGAMWGGGHTIMYDEAAERTVVAGAFQFGAYDATADRWEIIYERDPPWPAVQPWVYDPVNQRLLMWGSGYRDIVAFDLVTREWTVLLEPG